MYLRDFVYNQKSETIVRLAAEICEAYGGADGFDAFVTGGDPSEVRETLLELKGVGPKTADCVLLFAGGRDGVFPVDTHVERVGKRFGLIPPDTSAERAHEAFREGVPDDIKYPFHVLLVRHGREHCSAREPTCDESPVCDRFCSYRSQVVEGDVAPEDYPVEA